MKVKLSVSELVLFHLVQRFVYQYHTLFSVHKTHGALEDLTKLWFIKIFVNNDYFQNMPNSYLVDYEIDQFKNLLIVFRGALTYHSFYVSLDKPINSCVKYANNEFSEDDINIFSIEYLL